MNTLASMDASTPGNWSGLASLGSIARNDHFDVPSDLACHERYRVLRRLQSGGMGAVWLAEHLVMRRPFALKWIRPGLLAHHHAPERFLREVQAAAMLNHPWMNVFPWYGVVSGDSLEQGNLILGCPSYQVQANGTAQRECFDIVVMSHSCDLAHDKLQSVQVCPFWDLDALAQQVEYFRGKRGREEVRRGNLPGYPLLNRSLLDAKQTGYLVVDFRAQFAVDRAELKQLANAQQPRLRLMPPYREHLAQALARFYMRVGLPVDIPSF